MRLAPLLKVVIVLLLIGGLFVVGGAVQLFEDFKQQAGWTELFTGLALLVAGAFGARRYARTLDEAARANAAAKEIAATLPWERRTKL